MKAYHKLLVWDIMKARWPTRLAETLLNPLIGKSFVVYATQAARQAGVDAVGPALACPGS